MKLAALALALVVLPLAGCAAGGPGEATPTPTPTPASFDASGTIVAPLDFVAMLQKADPENDTSCITKAGYDDISGGAQVIVADGSGETVAVGSLDEGVIADNPSGTVPAKVCQFSFTATDVPPGSKFYSVHIGNVNRGEQTYTADQLKTGVSLTLG